MNYQAKTIRTFVGAKNYDESRIFYQELGFEEVGLSRTKRGNVSHNKTLGLSEMD